MRGVVSSQPIERHECYIRARVYPPHVPSKAKDLNFTTNYGIILEPNNMEPILLIPRKLNLKEALTHISYASVFSHTKAHQHIDQAI